MAIYKPFKSWAITISADKMKNKELETWLNETKAKNLNRDELYEFISLDSNCSLDLYISLKEKFNLTNQHQLTDYLFNQWQKEKEFNPKRGDWVLVNDYPNDDVFEKAIFLHECIGATDSIICVAASDVERFITGQKFNTTNWLMMKPLPTEQPKETDFKSQVIELIENEIKKCQEKEDENSKNKNYYHALILKNDKITYKDLLEKIKKLC